MTTLTDLERLARAATPGPWELDDEFCVYGKHEYAPRGIAYVGICRPVDGGRTDGADAAYIAALSPERVLAIIAVIEAAKAMRDKHDVEVVTDPRVLAFDAALAALEGEQK